VLASLVRDLRAGEADAVRAARNSSVRPLQASLARGEAQILDDLATRVPGLKAGPSMPRMPRRASPGAAHGRVALSLCGR
jgi:hypothetical protein